MHNKLQKSFDQIIKFAQSKDMGKVLAITGSLGWGLSCLAYTGAILLNKEIPEDQKEFLVPQELADGVINVSLFWFLTSKANKYGKQLVESGKYLPKQLEKEVTKLRAEHGKEVPFEQIAKNLSKEGAVKLKQFSKSFPALISITGSVLAANIFTPIVRNIVASKFQRHHIKHDSLEAKDKPATIEQPKPKSPAKPQLTKPYPIHPTGKIKI